MKKHPFYNKFVVEQSIYDALLNDVRTSVSNICQKYKDKLKDIENIEENTKGFALLGVGDVIEEYIYKDPVLKKVYARRINRKLVQKKMVKKAFKEIFNEILDEENVVDGDTVKTKKMLIAEKIVNGIITDTLDPVTLKGVEFLRDSIGEKPVNEVIQAGIQQKFIDVNISEDKVNKVKNILEGLRNKLTDGFEQNNTAGRSITESRDERVVETNVSGESERIHNVDVLPDKQD